MERLHSSKPLKILLGIVTALPLPGYVLSFVLPFLAFIPMAVQVEEHPHSAGPPVWFFALFFGGFAAQMLVWLLVVALIVFYIVHLFTTDRVRQDKKALWAVVLFLGNFFAMPVYFYLYVWQDPDEDAGEPA